ncbi:hypothetical protein GOP47_0024595 [Adiantum capillus-veneris]|uniref:Anaphase-promoting complex subunit 4 n=1 Tax=Adiantum capillus-veneris TaxID=13818 RepID=A0A9D4Z3S9_ADICA|nr:hypothetical protein GOP47_0024595 [Adiantum capillus-veneris]
MELDDEVEVASRLFTLHLDKALSSPIDKAVWNPEKDLLAMVTKDQQLIMHRFNWQRLWAVSPEKRVTSLCWRPDGKALAVGHEDGMIALHDVENGNVFRQTVTHQCSVECLTWVEERQPMLGTAADVFFYEDRTPRFFPPPAKSPAMPGAAPAFDVSGAVGFLEDQNSSADAKAALKSSHQRINILCSGDRNGTICLNVFGVFLIGRVEVRDLDIKTSAMDNSNIQGDIYRLLDAFILKVSLSENLQQLSVLCSGQLVLSCSQKRRASNEVASGLFCMQINSAIVGCRSKELHQVALQVSSIEELLEVLQVSLNVMQKLWSDAMGAFQEKFQGLAQLLREHGSHANAQEELLSLLSCGLASTGVHQFLAVSLGEGGLKRLSKTMDTAFRELHVIISEHLQPVAEILAFRVGELRGISRWRARLQSIGLEEKLVDRAMEDAGMLLVQVERLLRMISDTAAQFRMFFAWLTKSLRQLNNENSPSTDQLPSINSEAVALFLKTQFEEDLLGPHLAPVSEDAVRIEIGIEESERLEELALMGGFLDSTFLHKSLNQQISQLFVSCQKAFSMPSKIVSQQLNFENMLFLGQLHQPNTLIPISLTYYEEKGNPVSPEAPCYICFLTPNKLSEVHGIVGIIRECTENTSVSAEKTRSWEGVALQIGAGLSCIDLSLYKEKQLVLLGRTISSAKAWLMILPIDGLPYKKITGAVEGPDLPNLCLSNGAVSHISLRDGRARILSYGDVVPPLAVSASRGLACVFAGQRRALLYDLEEDEDGQDIEMD